MKFKGAVVTFALVEVGVEIIDSQTESAEALRFIARHFPGMQIVLMARDSNAKPRFRGRVDLVGAAERLEMSALPWRDVEVK